MTTSLASTSHANPSWGARVLRFPLTRIVMAIVLVGLTANLTFTVARLLVPDKAMRIMWPALIAAALCLGMYCLYVRFIEKRPVSEFSRPRAWRELGVGALTGMLLMSAVMGILALLGVYHITGSNDWTVMIVPIAELILIAFLEEIAFRGVLFRIIEKSLGTWIALILSSLLFALAHLSNDGANLLAMISVSIAGVLLAAAYLATRRLWFPIGIHFAWNYCLGEVFSVTVSGHQSLGLFEGNVVGPDWLTGGAFGVEASVVTPVLISIAAVYFLVRAKRMNTFVRPFWANRQPGDERSANGKVSPAASGMQ